MVASLSLKVSDIQNRVKRQFGDTAAVQISDTDIIDWINQALRELCRQNNVNKAWAATSTTANQANYTLPDGVLSVISVQYKGNSLAQLTEEEAEKYIVGAYQTNAQGYPSGTPSHYWVLGDVSAPQIYLYPAPSASGTTDLNIFYASMPTKVTTGTDDLFTRIPVEYHNRVLEYCLAQAYELDGNTALYQVKMTQFNGGVIDLKGRDAESELPFYETITSLPDDFGDSGVYTYT